MYTENIRKNINRYTYKERTLAKKERKYYKKYK